MNRQTLTEICGIAHGSANGVFLAVIKILNTMLCSVTCTVYVTCYFTYVALCYVAYIMLGYICNIMLHLYVMPF